MFRHVDPYAGDPVLSLSEACNADPRVDKANLSIGVYYDEDGRIPLLDLVRRAEVALAAEGRVRAYLPMEGHGAYREAVQRLVFGADCAAVRAKRITTVQTLGGSGALKVGADFLKRYFPATGVWVSAPTWDNHRSLFEGAGFTIGDYPYFDAATGGVDFERLLQKIAALPEQSIVVLHACCHNPTGVDLSRAQWETLIPLLVDKRLIPFMDMAYQGFGEGFDADAWPIRALTEAGASLLVASSFSKNLALYGERCGSLSVVCPDAEQAERVLGQLKFAVRRNYSSPPAHAAYLVTAILANPDLCAEWHEEVGKMRERISAMRRLLVDSLSARVPNRNFSYMMKQRGMFSYTGLNPTQVDLLRQSHGTYLVRTGRLCVAGLNLRNIEHVTRAMAEVM